MRHRVSLTTAALSVAACVCAAHMRTAEAQERKPLNAAERGELLRVLKAVDLAVETDVTADAVAGWEAHVLKGAKNLAYVPFTLSLRGLPDALKSTVVYIRAVSRHDGVRASDEHSKLTEWLVHGSAPPPKPAGIVMVPPGEMPVGGPAIGSRSQAVQSAAESLTALELQRRSYEKQKAAEEAAKARAEERGRDPTLFPFEDYAFFDLKAAQGDARTIGRALALPPGDYDVYVALLDHARARVTSPFVVKRTVTVPDYWNDRLAVSSLILVSGVDRRRASLKASEQSDHPYAFGLTDLTPLATRTLTTSDALSVVFQICNYGAPDSDLIVEYNFYRHRNGERVLFNRTDPQRYSDSDLPPAGGWESQAFAMQSVPLTTFPPGEYELEVSVRDRVTRGTAASTVAFSVASR